MFKYLILLTLIFIYIEAISQNLVPNPSFEEFNECPDDVTLKSKKDLIPHWIIPTRGTSDYFNSCSVYQVNVPDNIMGNMFALDGKAYAGIVLIERPMSDDNRRKPLNYREYIQTELTQKLKKDQLYSIKFYFAIASYSTYSVNKIGLYVSKSNIENRLNSKVLQVKPQIELDTLKKYNHRDYWYMVCDTFRAEGNEKFITIGNFYDDSHTKVEKLDCSIYRRTIQQTIKANKIAYYYIDVVSVTEIEDSTLNCCKDRYLVK